MSEVSDIEESETHDNNTLYSSEYVHKLKVKLKLCTDKVRDRNKIVRNQNEDIDNFLEDIASKERKILQLRDDVGKLRETVDKLRDELDVLRQNIKFSASVEDSEERLFDMKTPSFASTSADSSVSNNNNSLVAELIALVEECCNEINNLQYLVKESPSSTEVSELREKLRVSREKVNYLRAKLAKCVELGLISASMSREEWTQDSCPNVLHIPGKTVNEIKAENELLKLYNQELKVEINELREQALLHENDSPLHSSMFQDHEMATVDSLEMTSSVATSETKTILQDEDKGRFCSDLFFVV